MPKLRLNAYAKINWTLDVTGQRTDGYHYVNMLMQSIDLHDNVIIEESESGITVETDSDEAPGGVLNIAYKAADLLKSLTGQKDGVKITIDKKIPVAAGLAGGSTDAAAVLVGLNRLWNLNLSNEGLQKIGFKIGADVPFCIRGGLARAAGIGEKLSYMTTDKKIYIVLIKPEFGLSTKEIYSMFDIKKVESHPDNDMVQKLLKSGDVLNLSKCLVNVLETVSEKLHPEIKYIKSDLNVNGALGSIMTGSGPAVYGIFSGLDNAENAYNVLKKKYRQCFITYTTDSGVRFI